MTDYIGVILNGLLTGFGVVIGQHFYELYFKKKMTNVSEKIINMKTDFPSKFDSNKIVNNIIEVKKND